MATFSKCIHGILSYTNPKPQNVCLIFAWTANIFPYRHRSPPCWLMVIAADGNCRPQWTLPENAFMDFENMTVNFFLTKRLAWAQIGQKNTQTYTHTSYSVQLHYEVHKQRQKADCKALRLTESTDFVQRCTTKDLFIAFKIVIFPLPIFRPLFYFHTKQTYCRIQSKESVHHTRYGWSGTVSDYYLRQITSAKRRRLCFHLCWFVSLFVCLFVCLLATLRENSWIFKISLARYKEHSGKIWGWYDWPLAYRDSCYIFQVNSCLWAQLRKNRWTDFPYFFRKVRTWDKEQSGTFSGSCG